MLLWLQLSGDRCELLFSGLYLSSVHKDDSRAKFLGNNCQLAACGAPCWLQVQALENPKLHMCRTKQISPACFQCNSTSKCKRQIRQIRHLLFSKCLDPSLKVLFEFIPFGLHSFSKNKKTNNPLLFLFFFSIFKTVLFVLGMLFILLANITVVWRVRYLFIDQWILR